MNLPDRADHPFYTELIEHIRNSPVEVAALDFRHWCQVDFWVWCRFCMSSGEMLCRDPHNRHFMRPWLDHPWLFERCRDLQENPNGRFFKWARNSFKSTLITTNLTLWDYIQDLPRTANLRTLILTYKLDVAGEAMLSGIKKECEQNKKLHFHWPEVFWADPAKDSQLWTKQALLFRRTDDNSSREPSIRVAGLDNQPTSYHCDLIVMDDAVTREAVTSEDQIRKVFENMRTATFLGEPGVTKRRYIGTNWAIDDPWTRAERDGFFLTDNHPCFDANGEPVLQSMEALREWERMSGPYAFSCLPGDAPILMADWTEKPISEVRVGDRVVGYEGATVKVATVECAGRVGEQEVVEYTTTSGRSVRCTTDHRWYTGRWSDKGRRYRPLDRRHGTPELLSVVPPAEPVDPFEAGWLAGFYEGEGTFSRDRTIMFTQSEKNAVVCARLRRALSRLGFIWSEYRYAAKTATQFYIRGGRLAKVKFLRICDPQKWRDRIVASLFGALAGKSLKDGSPKGYIRENVVGRKSLGQQDVFNITTSTGNYVAYGFASKNCQMMGNPISSNQRIFLMDWFQDYGNDPEYEAKGKNVYIFADLALGGAESDFSVLAAIGLGADGHKYLLDLRRDRWSIHEFDDNLLEMARKWRPIRAYIEQFAMMTDVERIREKMRERRWRGLIVEPLPRETADGSPGSLSSTTKGYKSLMIQRLQDDMSRLTWWFPRAVGYRGKKDPRDAIQVLLEEEYRHWSPGTKIAHDDMLNTLAMVLNKNVPLMWPQDLSAAKDEVFRAKQARRRTSSGDRRLSAWVA